jgi:hypothetical protein
LARTSGQASSPVEAKFHYEFDGNLTKPNLERLLRCEEQERTSHNIGAMSAMRLHANKTVDSWVAEGSQRSRELRDAFMKLTAGIADLTNAESLASIIL